ncbi:hypothetical protein DAI22_11g123101 [Oryza sativa Japonica Group]|nr:hypothetical protein DAI22_11g123101 [Oryza sativa Japonica Group]
MAAAAPARRPLPLLPPPPRPGNRRRFSRCLPGPTAAVPARPSSTPLGGPEEASRSSAQPKRHRSSAWRDLGGARAGDGTRELSGFAKGAAPRPSPLPLRRSPHHHTAASFSATAPGRRGGRSGEAALPPSSPSRFLRGADEQGTSGVVGGGWRRTTPEAGTAAEDPEAGGDDPEVGAAADAPKDPATSSSPSNAAASSWWWPRRWPELSLSPPTPVAASPLSPSTPASASPLSHPAPAQIGETGHEARGHSRTAMPFSPVHLLTKNA